MAVARYPVVVFDLDGTLLRETSVLTRLAEGIGNGVQVAELERRLLARELNNHDVADLTAAWFAGHDPEALWVHLEDAPWITGLEATIAALLELGCDVLLATITWRFAAELLQRRYGFHAVSGVEMELEDGLLSGRLGSYFDPDDKPRFIAAWCAQRGLELAQVAAIGDSRFDVPMFSAVGHAIALNATPEARAAADVCVDTEDLTDVLELLVER